MEIPEVIQNIFELADQSTQVAGARVCRNWSTRALDSLWSSLESVVPLLQVMFLSDGTFQKGDGQRSALVSLNNRTMTRS